MTLQNKFLKDYRRMFRLVSSGGTFVAFDTETTGLSAENCRIIEIGAVKFDRTGILEKFSTLVNPLSPVPFEITKITNITDQMLKDKPEIKDVLGDFLSFLEDCTVVGHNVQFDIRFLNAECERNGFPPVDNQVIDTLQFARWAFPAQKKYKQTTLAELLDVEVSAAHRAFDDAKVCGNIFLELIKATAERQKS